MELKGVFGGLRQVDRRSRDLAVLRVLQVIGFIAAGVIILRFMIPELISPHAERFASSQYVGFVLFSAILAGAYIIILLLPGDVMRRRIRGVRIAAVVQVLWFGGEVIITHNGASSSFMYQALAVAAVMASLLTLWSTSTIRRGEEER